jgi:uncharacterized membrane protein
MSTPAPRGVLTVGAVGFLLFVVGIVVLVMAAEPVVVYEGSYTPLAPNGVPWTIVVTGGQLIGAVMAVVGVVLLAGVAGWLLGADRMRSRQQDSA